jgi:hypothetical protein
MLPLAESRDEPARRKVAQRSFLLCARQRALADVTQANSLVDWNDYPHRKQQEVLDAFDSAIARIEGDRGQD